MDFGRTVCFSSHPHPFMIRDDYCANPACSCNEVSLTFKEFVAGDEVARKPLQFRVRVHLETWQECDPPTRSLQVTRWVREFLAECPETQRAQYKSEYEQGKQFARRKAEYTMDPRAVLSGELVSYADILSDRAALSSGGHGFTHRFFHGDREFLVEDLYCPKPTCECQSFCVQFWERVPAADDDEESAGAVEQRFLGQVSFDGDSKVVRLGPLPREEAASILTAWCQQYQDEPMFGGRYECVKEVGRRSVKDYVPTRPANSGEFPVGGRLSLPHDAHPTSPTRHVGRNDPCPCGSGKKFKRCCARLHPNQPLFPG